MFTPLKYSNFSVWAVLSIEMTKTRNVNQFVLAETLSVGIKQFAVASFAFISFIPKLPFEVSFKVFSVAYTLSLMKVCTIYIT